LNDTTSKSLETVLLNEGEDEAWNDKENVNYVSNTNTQRPLRDLTQTEVLDLLDDMPQYKSTFAISKVTGSVLVDCNSVKVIVILIPSRRSYA